MTKKPLALVVDDDNASRITMVAALRKAGFETEQADNGEKAVDVFTLRQPDLVFLDVMMPGMDGFDTCRAIRACPGGEYVQILMVTGLDDTKSIEKSFLAGGNDFVSKPINWAVFGHRARYMLRAGKALKDAYLSRGLLAQTQDVAKIGNWKIDFQTGLCTISSEAMVLLGFGAEVKEDLSISEMLDLLIGQHKPDVYDTVVDSIRGRESFTINFQRETPQGSAQHIYMRGETLLNENRKPDFLLGVVQDITRMKRAEDEIRYLAFYDSLTGLANRTLFLDRLKKIIEYSERNGRSFALLFMDIDNFKQINDTMGHYAGDILLKNTAAIIKKCTRKSDTVGIKGLNSPGNLVARHGGDEFVLILAEIASPESAAIVARRLLEAIPQPQIIENQEISVTTSIGISVYPEDGTDTDVLFRHADTAMYHAKKIGRNNFQFFDESFNAAAVARFSLEQDLKVALANDDFILYFQPQFNLIDQKVVGVEALIRWNHREKGFIAPDQFIAIAEDCGLIVEINKWVIRAACEQSRKWSNKGLADVRIAVNLSGYRLGEQDIVGTLKANLDKFSLSGRNIEVEVTENVLMQNTEAIVETLKGMKELGVRVSLDDFGTGYSSLSYLTSFQVDVIKIDRSFVMGCISNNKNKVIIKAIIAMGHSLGMKIVAEGVETLEQFEFLKKYDCDECQGYYFSPAVPAIEIEQRLLKASAAVKRA
ncbi:EAL domain-containing protein [Desulforhopalus sp. IMCC35007]|uniref:EAL domain-containing protein n=1 Tax=Desulforhopalus sp. IMCC35007 TaxID=2569543 RepID=UPI0010ADFE8B|nr:EAL domain-containing protein [Desulforhopalus sp. IMCC35007]TKB06453.1 EAL domain-containing protein [Desulforhopalus sp. IMCC35007]